MKKAKIDKPVKPIAGRQRLTWPVLESIQAVCAALHYTPDEVKLCKKKNPKPFLQNGRIDTGLLIPALNDILHSAAQLPEGFATWKEFREMCQAKLSDVELKEAQGKLMLRSEAMRENANAWAFVFAELERFCIEKPPTLAGRNAVEIHEYLVEFKEHLRKTAKKKFEDAA